MTDEESVAIVFEVKDMALALREARDQRDKLREALEKIESMDTLLGHKMKEIARAALAATEEPAQ